MPKRDDESLVEYKKRVIDPISHSFCAAKWYNATIWLGSGTTASCHHPPAHRIDAEEVRQNPAALHNTRHKKLMRSLMLKGERPKECEYCWKIEDIARDNVSDRVFKTVIYSDADIAALRERDWKKDVNLKTMEIAFDRTCNFACSYCNASFSTTWGKDISLKGPYQNLISDGAAAFQQDGKWAQPYLDNEQNPYIQAFWKWWPELSQSLQELRVTGGEPLMSPDVWKLLEFFKQDSLKRRERSQEGGATECNEMLFSLNSNLGSQPALIEKLIEYSKHIGKFDLYTSGEGFGEQAEYIRDGLKWDLWTKNVQSVLERANLRSFHVMMTINSLCLFSITDFMDFLLECKSRYGKYKVNWSVNLLRFPSFMSPLALPDSLKDNRREHLKRWLARNESFGLIHDWEHAALKRLIDYLEVVDSPHSYVSGKQSQWRDFRSFYEQYDRRRGKDFRKTFPPNLVDWYETIPMTDLKHYQNLVDGDATNIWKNNADLKAVAEKEGWCLEPQSVNPGSVDFKEKR